MATPYSQDLRDRVLRAYDRGMKTKRIAETVTDHFRTNHQESNQNQPVISFFL